MGLRCVVLPSAALNLSEEICRDLVIVAKWGIESTGKFFRIMYSRKLWLTRAEAQAAVCAGFDMVDSSMHSSMVFHQLFFCVNAT